MNQNDIDKYLDDMITEDAKKIDVVFAQRLREINQQIAALYAKYSRDGQLSMADMNKYNRFKKEMERMTEESSKAFKTILTIGLWLLSNSLRVTCDLPICTRWKLRLI